MKSFEQIKQHVQQEKLLNQRLSLAKARLEEAKQERIWAIVSAHSEGLSIRKIAAATGLSSSRVHQLLHSEEANHIPEFLSSLNQYAGDEAGDSLNNDSQSLAKLEKRITSETKIMRWCLDWLEQLERGERVVVNLQAGSDREHAFEGVNRQWVLRVLRRVTADLDRLSRQLPTTEGEVVSSDPNLNGVIIRRRPRESEPVMSSFSIQQQKEILREQTIALPEGS